MDLNGHDILFFRSRCGFVCAKISKMKFSEFNLRAINYLSLRLRGGRSSVCR
jgi:hypothetical protein